MKKGKLAGILYAVILTAFTVYVLLDTFVITKVYTVVETDTAEADPGRSEYTAADGGDSEKTAGADDAESTEVVIAAEAEDADASVGTEENSGDTAAETIVTENSYSDGNMTITITEYREYDTSIYVADIVLSSADYLKTAFAQNAYGKNVTAKTSETAKESGAILAINGDYYGAQESGYVIRNGVLYRDTAKSGQEDLVIYSDGSFEIITEDEISAQELIENGAVQVLSFGPALVENGEIAVSEGEEVGKAMASNPRTAIGIIDDLHYVFVVSDGRTSESEGLSLSQLAEFMSGLGVETAYNLDGGGSSTMYFNGEIINNPTTSGRSIKERSVSDIVYIGE